MRILVDESLPVSLAAELRGHDVSTVRAQRWLGLQNGALLRSAVDAGFVVIVTADRALRYQQNLDALGIAVVLVTGVRNRMGDLQPVIPRILEAIVNIQRGQLVEVTG